MSIKEFLSNKVKQQAVSKLKSDTTDNQVKYMSDALDKGYLSPRTLRRQIERSAPNEMRKGRDRLIKEGKTPTVDNLLEEYRTSGFRELANRVGLDEAWFIALAEQYTNRDKVGGRA